MRIPVFSGHSLVVHAQFEREITPQRARELLARAEGVCLDNLPTPRRSAGRDESFVGRIRQDRSYADKTGLIFFIACDNLRKGAALNAIQIAEVIASRC